MVKFRLQATPIISIYLHVLQVKWHIFCGATSISNPSILIHWNGSFFMRSACERESWVDRTFLPWNDTESLGTLDASWPIAPNSDDRRKNRTFAERQLAGGNWQTRRKPVPLPLCPQKILHELSGIEHEPSKWHTNKQPAEIWRELERTDTNLLISDIVKSKWIKENTINSLEIHPYISEVII